MNGTAVEPALRIEAVDPQHPEALRLLAEAALEARALYPELFAADSPPPRNPALGEREVYLLAWRDGRASGCVALHRRGAFSAEMRRMFVSRDLRRRGIARALLAAIEAQAARLGYREMVLETGRRQAPAIALYDGCGWRRIPAFGAYVGDPMSVCFGKSVSPARG